MARKPALSEETLLPLGTERLARLVLDEAEANPNFRKRVTAALAGIKGPDAVAKLIDRRLAALEGARAMIAWEKERAFRDDLRATVATIVKDLAPLSPAHAVDRLIRFVDTHGGVFERIDDSGGHIQGVYWEAAEAVPDLVAQLDEVDRALLPDRLLVSLKRDTHELALHIAVAVVPLLPKPALDAWDKALSGARRTGRNGAERDDQGGARIRQAIADMRGDVDAFIALEAQRPEWQQNPLAVAERLFAANRLEQALTWVRKPRKGGLAFATHADIAEGRIRRVDDTQRVPLEARILEAMGRKTDAQAVRWAAFEGSLNADILRDYIAKLDDFIEHEELERAFAHAARGPNPYSALHLLIGWPRLDLAATLVLDRRTEWNGGHYGVLVPAAEALAERHPLAATVLFRALLDDILARAKAQAYGHGARYLARLAALADGMPDDARLVSHAAYAEGLRKAHGRKAGFWALVKGL
jgi:hypothetical protein